MDVFGLPLHPLVVHATVVLLPLACLGALAVVASARARERFGWLVVAFAAAAAVSAVVTRLSGESLAQNLGVGELVANHQRWGELVPFPAVALALILPVGLLLRTRRSWVWPAAVVLVVVAATAGVVLVALAGHSGASAVWGG